MVGAVSIALIGALVYLNALHNPFVYDDHRLILENRTIDSLGNWRALLWHDLSRPVVNLSYAIDYAIWRGPSAFGFHLTNLIIHLVNVVLLFGFADALTRQQGSQGSAPQRRTAAVAAALLFAVHPVLTQAVGYVSARPDLLSLMFMLLALLSARAAFSGSAWWWSVSGVAWLLAVGSKEVAIMFPMILLAHELFRAPEGDERGRGRRLAICGVFLAVAVVAGVIRLGILAGLESAAPLSLRWDYGLVELDVFRRYAQLIVVPRGQTIFHAIDPLHAGEARAFLALVFALVFLAAIWWFRRTRISFGLAWFALCLLPPAILVMLDSGEPMAEHRLYAASAGLFIAAGEAARVATAAARRTDRRLGIAAMVAGVAIVIVLGFKTFDRNIVWRNPVWLWLEAAEYAPDHWLPRIGLGEALHESGRHAEAAAMFEQTIALRPSEPLAFAKLGECQLEEGQLAAADRTFRQLLIIEPGSPAGLAGLGFVAARSGRDLEAATYLQQAMTKDPTNPAILAALAEIRTRRAR